jgi:hypothetical protein
VKRLGDRFQTQAIGRGAVKYEEHLDVCAKLIFESRLRRVGIGVVAVADHMPLVRPVDGLQYRGMDPGIVVAGEAASGFHEFNNLTEERKEESSTHLFPVETSKKVEVLDIRMCVTIWLHIILSVKDFETRPVSN